FLGVLYKSYDSYNEADTTLRIYLGRLGADTVDAVGDDVAVEENATLRNINEKHAMEDD
ncbi:unnamed protein product, partial [Ilex paraguariensis]